MCSVPAVKNSYAVILKLASIYARLVDVSETVTTQTWRYHLTIWLRDVIFQWGSFRQ